MFVIKSRRNIVKWQLQTQKTAKGNMQNQTTKKKKQTLMKWNCVEQIKNFKQE